MKKGRVSKPTQLFISSKAIVLGLHGLTAQMYDNLKIYPNPTSGVTELEIQTEAVYPLESLKIFDLSGKEVTALAWVAPSASTGFEVDISRLVAGIYLFVLETKPQLFFLGRVVKK